MIDQADVVVIGAGSFGSSTAYHLAQFDHRPGLGTHVRGDIGTGENRDWNALAEPFDLPPAWLRVLRHRIMGELWVSFAQRVLDGQLFDAGPRMRSVLEHHLAANPLGGTRADFASRLDGGPLPSPAASRFSPRPSAGSLAVSRSISMLVWPAGSA